MTTSLIDTGMTNKKQNQWVVNGHFLIILEVDTNVLISNEGN